MDIVSSDINIFPEIMTHFYGQRMSPVSVGAYNSFHMITQNNRTRWAENSSSKFKSPNIKNVLKIDNVIFNFLSSSCPNFFKKNL